MTLSYIKQDAVMEFEGADLGEWHMLNLLRGAILNRIRDQVCDDMERPCADCLLRPCCVYPYLFDNSGRGPRDYPPYIFSISGWSEDFDTLSLGLILFRSHSGSLPYFQHALRRMERERFGHLRMAMRILDIRVEEYSVEHPELLPPEAAGSGAVKAIELDFLSPARLEGDGKVCRQFELRVFFLALRRRLLGLFNQYGEPGLPSIGEDELLEILGKLSVADKTEFVEWERQSSRQQDAMRWNGIVGKVRLGGAGVARLLPLLKAGEDFHVGRSTSFGLGRYRVLPAG